MIIKYKPLWQRSTPTLKCMLYLILCLISPNRFAWGFRGHAVVAEIAWRHLTPLTQQSIRNALGAETIQSASRWSDQVKSNPAYRSTKSWHYTYHIRPSQQHDLHWALAFVINQLQSSKPTIPHKEALKHLIHLVGDAHQPLHFDPYHVMGGNLCWVRYQGKAVNMHQLIDRLLLDQRHQSIDQMADAIDSINLEDTSHSRDLHDWLTESKTALRQIYPVPIAKLPFYCKASQTQHLKIIHSEQIQQLQHHVNHQLALAGRRLAMILNAIYDPMQRHNRRR